MAKKYFYQRYWGAFTDTERPIGFGYSGIAGNVMNNSSYERKPDEGPIPKGTYTISLTDNEKGQLTHHLEPDTTNKMYKRSGFMIHGDNAYANHSASTGCIVAPYSTRFIFRVGDVIEVT